MAKNLKFNNDARLKMLDGIKILSNAVGVTLGPKGRNVMIEQDFGAPLIVNDGVTIAKAIELKDPFENLGAAVIIEAANKTNDAVGDGTTTAIILSSTLIEEGMKFLDQGHNPVLIRNGLNHYLNIILGMVDEVSTSADSSEDLKKVATISSGSAEVGGLICDAYNEVGPDGKIIVEESQGMETYLDIVKGYSYDRGFLSPYFANNQEKMLATLDNPFVLVTDKKIVTMQELLPHLEKAMGAGRPLLIICDDMEQEVLAALIMNKLRGVFQVVVTKAPSFGDRKNKMLEDIAISCGATFVDSSLGININDEIVKLGSAKRIIISREQTTIVDGLGSGEEILARAENIRKQISETNSEYDREKLEERLAKLVGGIGVIRIGATTEPELKELKLRIEDALCATKAAMTSGVIEGGGKVFYEISEKLKKTKTDSNYKESLTMLEVALKAPFKQIITNAGDSVDAVIKQVDQHLWYDAMSGKMVSLKEAGIIDPTSVAKSALKTAVSIAGIFLTTECAITSEKQKNINEDNLL